MKVKSRRIVKTKPCAFKEFATLHFEDGDKISEYPAKLVSKIGQVFMNSPATVKAKRFVHKDGEALSPWFFMFHDTAYTVEDQNHD